MKQISAVCVAGAGFMGRQIALNAAFAGYDVSLKAYGPEGAPALAWCRDYLDKGIAKGRVTEQQKASTLSRIRVSESLRDAVSGADLVIESIIEDESAKRMFFSEVGQFVREDALLTSNSSYLPSSKYADVVRNPARLANLHYFNPVMQMRLVEIVRGPHTCDETIEALKGFVGGIGKQYIVIHKEIEGFVVNRLLRAIQDEAYFLFGQGVASFEDIDIAAEKGLNHPMGPFRLVDLTGIDINYYNRQRKFDETGREEDRPPEFIAEKFSKGEFGKKTGKGWYTYE